MTVYINFIDGRPVAVELPQQVVCTIAETEPVVKGQTAGFVLQTGDFGQRRPHHGSAVYQPG